MEQVEITVSPAQQLQLSHPSPATLNSLVTSTGSDTQPFAPPALRQPLLTTARQGEDEKNDAVPWYQRGALWKLIRRFLWLSLIVSLSCSGLFSWRKARQDYGEYLLRMTPFPDLPVLLLLLSSIAYLSALPGAFAPLCLITSAFPLQLSLPMCYLASILATLLNLIVVRCVLRPALSSLPASCPSVLSAPSKLARSVSLLPVTTTVLLRLPYLGLSAVSTRLALSPIHPVPLFVGNCIGLLPGCLLWSLAAAYIVALFDWVSRLEIALRLCMMLVVVCVLMAFVSAAFALVKWRLRALVRAEVIKQRTAAGTEGRRRRSEKATQEFADANVSLS
jgi:hypothetical protein